MPDAAHPIGYRLDDFLSFLSSGICEFVFVFVCVCARHVC